MKIRVSLKLRAQNTDRSGWLVTIDEEYSLKKKFVLSILQI